MIAVWKTHEVRVLGKHEAPANAALRTSPCAQFSARDDQGGHENNVVNTVM